jgi:hypothetical protein
MGNNQNWECEEIYKLRREFIKSILFTKGESWCPETWTKDVYFFQLDNLPRTSDGRLASLKPIEESAVDLTAVGPSNKEGTKIDRDL